MPHSETLDCSCPKHTSPHAADLEEVLEDRELRCYFCDRGLGIVVLWSSLDESFSITCQACRKVNNLATVK
jgi:hypothetical protein